MNVGLECKAAWCEKILRGEKTVELRQYDLPQEYLGKKVWLLASSGPEGVSSIPDTVAAGADGISVVGWVRFAHMKIYNSKEDWAADAALHHVPEHTPYSWKAGETKAIYGWVVESCRRLPAPKPVPGMRRLKRSLFALDADP